MTLTGKKIRTIIIDEDNGVYVSAVTGWETAINRALGKLQSPNNLEAMVEEVGFIHLPTTLFHGEQAGSLPMHHRNLFDRMLVAQAQAEGLTIVTRDQHIPNYCVRTLAA